MNIYDLQANYYQKVYEAATEEEINGIPLISYENFVEKLKNNPMIISNELSLEGAISEYEYEAEFGFNNKKRIWKTQFKPNYQIPFGCFIYDETDFLDDEVEERGKNQFLVVAPFQWFLSEMISQLETVCQNASDALINAMESLNSVKGYVANLCSIFGISDNLRGAEFLKLIAILQKISFDNDKKVASQIFANLPKLFKEEGELINRFTSIRDKLDVEIIAEKEQQIIGVKNET